MPQPAEFDLQKHTFNSATFRGVVADAISFFSATPAHQLPPVQPFTGGGVYGLYYTGPFQPYGKLSAINKNGQAIPIYVGKAVPKGWRTSRNHTAADLDHPLFRRLKEHARSIEHAASTLNPADFQFRFMVLNGDMGDLVVPVEAELIRVLKPLWNVAVDGFGNHDPGSGRYQQSCSEWDVLHPGRPWASRLTGSQPTQSKIIAKIHQALA